MMKAELETHPSSTGIAKGTGVDKTGKDLQSSIARKTRSTITNAMTVDVEDYFQVAAFADCIGPETWDSFPCRVERNVSRILQLFADHHVSATFFTLGWIAKRYPQMVRSLIAAGHELASHGFDHTKVHQQTRDQFRSDIRSAKQLLEDVSGTPVIGYRAPSFSINAQTTWAFDVLAEEGYRYSSSVYPIRHDHYGMREAPRFAFTPRGISGVIELPLTACHFLGSNWPCAGGGYFRLMPYAIARWAIRRVNRVDGRPCIFYFHPWEIDPDQPVQKGLKIRARMRHYLNLHRMEQRLHSVLSDFAWSRIDRVFPQVRAGTDNDQSS